MPAMWDGPLAGLVVGVLLALIVAQLFRTFWPGVPPPFLAALTLSLAGVLAGQVWAWLGLPGVDLGSANLLPALAFAALLQPLAGRIRLPFP
ncbi:MAG TPA: hypothetical protein VFD01_17145 [Candidatus Dormibacteraeota bacterium]|nr:hypothetical protein [Candidatus Dormibacteraeota bacterium]